MGRMQRFDLAGIPLHIVQRGNNRLPCFLDDADRSRYLRALEEALLRHDCALHAWVLMFNHVHLLVTPASAGAVSRMMHTLGRNYATYFNIRHGRTGTLWEGRFKSCLVDTDTYLLRCYRYIELNPVRAWMVSDPSEYRWSSFAGNACGGDDPLVTPHSEYLRLGATRADRQHAYAELFAEVLSDSAIAEIRAYLQQQRVLGHDSFRARVEARVNRFCNVRPAHRPRLADN